MAREVEMGTDYQLVVEIARRIEGYRQRGRDYIQEDKRTRFSREFRGDPARGKGQFGRCQPSRPTYLAPPPLSRGAPARPYFSAMLESSYRLPVNQGSSSSYFSAMPESSYCPPAIQGSSSGYSGHQGQTSGQQSMALRGCYECRDLGNMKRFCPRLRGKAVQQGHQPMITAPVIRPPRNGGQAGRGHSRGRGQARGGQPAIVQPGGGQPTGAPARFYAFSARPEAVASDAVITFIPQESLVTPVYVSTPLGDSVVVDRIYRSCTQPISIPQYCMAPKELKELKEQLEELLEKGFVDRVYHLGGFSSIAAPLTRLTQKGAPFRWSNDCEASFQKLKTSLTTAPVLVFPSGSRMYTVYCDASRVGLGYVLMQEGQFIAYSSRKENVVPDLLRRKAESMGRLAFISAEKRLLALDIQSLANRLVMLDISEPSRDLACVVA
ncbi:uncharacterized protein [Nicotiana tomentosiformis]|uniref:uncharacterized protein n=1 Tax=Nicotiana tomentosiformis TaxID=4098 RepID=UPI00388C4626